jgi:hypothetical protein
MFDIKKLLIILYITLVMILVSLDGTYNITYTLFGHGGQKKYGIGMKINNPGFIISIILFAVLVSVPILA